MWMELSTDGDGAMPRAHVLALVLAVTASGFARGANGTPPVAATGGGAPVVPIEGMPVDVSPPGFYSPGGGAVSPAGGQPGLPPVFPPGFPFINPNPPPGPAADLLANRL